MVEGRIEVRRRTRSERPVIYRRMSNMGQSRPAPHVRCWRKAVVYQIVAGTDMPMSRMYFVFRCHSRRS
jgi:hypothetical protein